MNRKLVRVLIRWLLLAAIVLYAVTGFGITEFRVVETLTFGVLTKNLAFKIHDILFIPSLILLLLHIGFPYIAKLTKRKGSVPFSPIN